MAQSKGRFVHYEGMFLLAQADGSNLGEATDHIQSLLDRAGAEVIALRKWDERRLAYPIRQQKRGVYLLAYFGCDPIKIEQLDRDCNLSEIVQRALITRADHLTREQMEAANAVQELRDEAEMRDRGEDEDRGRDRGDRGERGEAQVAGSRGEREA